jgi:hypothetical protein
MSKKAERGRGQLHSRGQRSWRDETNPAGTSGPADEAAHAADGSAAHADRPEDEASKTGAHVHTTSTDGPGGGGATESPDRAKHHEGLHGGPSRKR